MDSAAYKSLMAVAKATNGNEEKKRALLRAAAALLLSDLRSKGISDEALCSAFYSPELDFHRKESDDFFASTKILEPFQRFEKICGLAKIRAFDGVGHRLTSEAFYSFKKALFEVTHHVWKPIETKRREVCIAEAKNRPKIAQREGPPFYDKAKYAPADVWRPTRVERVKGSPSAQNDKAADFGHDFL